MLKRVTSLLVSGLLAAAFLAPAGEAGAVQAPPLDVAPGVTFARVPFVAGERATYQVRLGAVSVGRGSMEVLGVENVHGRPTYHTRLQISGGLPLARVNDTFESWIDVEGLFSRRFRQNQQELRYRRNRTYEFYPESRTFRRTDNGQVGRIPTDRPLDDVSFLYYARTLPLRVGETYTIERYFKEDGNPVVLKVLRKQTIEVPAGRFETIVVQPIIQTDGLFGEGGEAEVFFTDDARRLLVQLRSKVPLIGSLTLNLQSYEAGQSVPSGSAR